MCSIELYSRYPGLPNPYTLTYGCSFSHFEVSLKSEVKLRFSGNGETSDSRKINESKCHYLHWVPSSYIPPFGCSYMTKNDLNANSFQRVWKKPTFAVKAMLYLSWRIFRSFIEIYFMDMTLDKTLGKRFNFPFLLRQFSCAMVCCDFHVVC